MEIVERYLERERYEPASLREIVGKTAFDRHGHASTPLIIMQF